MDISKNLDNFEEVDRAFAAALRNKEFFYFLKDVFSEMNKIMYESQKDGPLTSTYFLDKVYNSTTDIGKNWSKIEVLYEKSMAPIRTPKGYKKFENPKIKKIKDSLFGKEDDGSEFDDVEEDEEFVQAREFVTVLNKIYPPPTGPGQEILNFARYFATRPIASAEEDFYSYTETLFVISQSIAGFWTDRDNQLKNKDLKKCHEERENRMRKVRSLFSRASSNSISGGSDLMIELALDDSRVKRILTHSGEDFNSFDAVLGGLPGIGLTTVIGGTGGGKTIFKSCLVANYCLNAFRTDKIPVIWGWIGEDGPETYVRRVMTNVLNRLSRDLEIDPFNMFNLTQIVKADPKVAEYFKEIVKTILVKTDWLKSPTQPEQKLNFSILNILNYFNAKLDAGQEKPDFIILDYFNLLNLPKNQSSGNRPQDLSLIAHLIDDWAEQNSIAVITSVQASSSGLMQARDGLRFFDLEDQHESKSIAHSSRMVLSLLPHTDEFNDDGSAITRKMGLKVLKNRGGEKGGIFLSSYDEAKNIVMSDSAKISEADWQRHKTKITERQTEIMSGEAKDNKNNKKEAYAKKKPQADVKSAINNAFKNKGTIDTGEV